MCNRLRRFRDEGTNWRIILTRILEKKRLKVVTDQTDSHSRNIFASRKQTSRPSWTSAKTKPATPFRTPATTYQFAGHHIPQVQSLPWAGMRCFKEEINFDRMFHIFDPTSINIGGGGLTVMPLRIFYLRENRFGDCHIVPLDIFVYVSVVFVFNAREK